jgi:hypothetical protein
MDRPLAIRSHWHYVDYEQFVRGTRESTLQLPEFKEWVPAAVMDEAKKLYVEISSQDGSGTEIDLLLRLISDERMRSVWQELYKKKRVNYKSTDEFLHPIHVRKALIAASLRRQAAALRKRGDKSNNAIAKKSKEVLAKGWESEASLLEKETCDLLANTSWSEQDLGAQVFLWQTYHTARDIKPAFLADIKVEVNTLRQAAGQLRELSTTLQSFRIECDALHQIASRCDFEAQNRDRDPTIDDPWIITRKRNDARIRMFVAYMSIIMQQLFEKTETVDAAARESMRRRQLPRVGAVQLYGSIATIVNVVFQRADMTGDRVREMVRSAAGD